MFTARRAVLFLLIAVSACRTPTPSPAPSPHFGKNEIALYKLADQGKRGLISHFIDSLGNTGEVPQSIRILSLVLCAAPNDSSGISLALDALRDTSAETRRTAAWALGNIGLASSANTLAALLKTEKNKHVRSSAWEALGKCLPTDKSELIMLLPSGSSETEGWLKGWYALVLRDRQLPLPESLYGMIPADSSTTFWYWHILGRSRFELSGFEDARILHGLKRNDIGLELSCAIATASWRARDTSIIRGLAKISLDCVNPAQVRAALTRSLAPAGAYTIREIQNLLKDPEYQVRKTMAEALKALEKKHNWQGLETNCPETLALLLEAQYLQSKEPAIKTRMLDSIYRSANPYTQSFFVSSLPFYTGWPETIIALLDTAQSPLLMSSLATNAVSRFEELTAQEQQALVQSIFRRKDSGSMAILCGMLSSRNYSAAALPGDLLPAEDLDNYRKSLVLPKETECHNAIATLLRDRYAMQCDDYRPAWNHPTDWAVLNGLAEHRAILFTSEGDISLELDPWAAPGSVADFIRLAREGYFDGKSIHRVVPNFVAQGGCPRGDGWGSLDYTLRTEICQKPFGTGSIGLASAGRNTESCQWFITHSPTPNLNGRYTVFGRVVEGMETVNMLKVGTRILRVEIIE